MTLFFRLRARPLLIVCLGLVTACQPDQAKEPEYLGANCLLRGDVTSSKGINLAVNSCVSYQGYSQEEVVNACISDVDKWQDFAKNSGKVKLDISYPVTCPTAVAKCTSIESVDADFKVTQRKVLYHYGESSKEIEARRRGCEVRRGEFVILSKSTDK